MAKRRPVETAGFVANRPMLIQPARPSRGEDRPRTTGPGSFAGRDDPGRRGGGRPARPRRPGRPAMTPAPGRPRPPPPPGPGAARGGSGGPGGGSSPGSAGRRGRPGACWRFRRSGDGTGRRSRPRGAPGPPPGRPARPRSRSRTTGAGRPRGTGGRRRGSPRAGRAVPGPISRAKAEPIRTLPSPRIGLIAPSSATGRRLPTVMSARPSRTGAEQAGRRRPDRCRRRRRG